MTDRYRKFIPVVCAVSWMSKDRSTKVGAIALGPDMEIRSTGYNGFPRGVNDDLEHRHERPLKYEYAVHAESNVIANAARFGASLKGCTLMVSSLYPCSACARLIIQAGITHVMAVEVDDEAMERWKESAKISLEMFAEAGVRFTRMDE